MNLPESNGHTVIVVIIDQFSKVMGLIPLSTLPTAFELLELLFNHAFRYFDIPKDIASDQGSQFIFRVGWFHGEVGGYPVEHANQEILQFL